MSSNWLRLNSHKTLFIWLGIRQQLAKLDMVVLNICFSLFVTRPYKMSRKSILSISSYTLHIILCSISFLNELLLMHIDLVFAELLNFKLPSCKTQSVRKTGFSEFVLIQTALPLGFTQ